MGIVKLAKLIKEEAPDAVRPVTFQDYHDRVVALDASVAIYQFRTAMPQMINRHGQNISSLQGLFFRTLHLLEKDLKPLFVFEGKPPKLKQLVAPAEAEATCAALVKSGHAWCAATEDMDALPFGAVRLLRHLSVRKSHLEEISLPTVLQKLGMTQEQFVDLCILLGCDYCGKVRGLGPKKALKLLQLHGSIEEVLRNTSRESHPIPDGWHLEEARRLFLQPEVADPGQAVLEWKEPDEEGVVNFLAHQKCMKESRVRGRLEKWRAARKKRREAQEAKAKAQEAKAKAQEAKAKAQEAKAKAQEAKAKGRPRKAAKTMKDFFPILKRPDKAPVGPPAQKKQKLSEKAPGISKRHSLGAL